MVRTFDVRSIAARRPLLPAALGALCALAGALGFAAGCAQDAPQRAAGGDASTPDASPVESWPEGGSSTAQDGGPADGGADAPVSEGSGDAGAPDVASADAGDAASSTWCGAQPASVLFCADFDEASPLSAFTQSTSQGTLAISTAGAESPPAELLVSASPATSSSPRAYAQHALGAFVPTDRTRLRLKMRVDQSDANQSANVAWLGFNVGLANESNVALYVAAGSARVDEYSNGSTTAGHPLPDAVPFGAWVDLVLEVHQTAGGAATLLVVVDGKTELSAVPLSATFTTGPQGPTVARVGLTYVNLPTAAWTIAYDNLLVEGS
jgi:hypothetical protein